MLSAEIDTPFGGGRRKERYQYMSSGRRGTCHAGYGGFIIQHGPDHLHQTQIHLVRPEMDHTLITDARCDSDNM